MITHASFRGGRPSQSRQCQKFQGADQQFEITKNGPYGHNQKKQKQEMKKTTQLLTRLYQASSTLPTYKGVANVKVNWFVPFRADPVVDYHECICPSAVWRASARQGCDEFLTTREIDRLREYLRQNGVCDFTVTPMKNLSAPCRSIMLNEGARDWNFLKLDEQIGYDLPFKVWGLHGVPRISGAAVYFERIDRKASGARTCCLTGRIFKAKPPFAFYLDMERTRVVCPEAIEEFDDLREMFNPIEMLRESAPRQIGQRSK